MLGLIQKGASLTLRRFASLQAFKEQGIVPEVIQQIPNEVCKITYPSRVSVNLGNKLTPTEVKSQPDVEWNSEPQSFYLLCMTDPDAPSRAEPKFREWHHWLVGNIPGCKVNSGDILSAYIGSGPPPDTGFHRYVFLVYRQPGKIEFSVPRLDEYSQNGRPNFRIAVFAEKHQLGQPIAGNFYLAEWDSYVPTLYKQLGG